jgi:hypothetical protein
VLAVQLVLTVRTVAAASCAGCVLCTGCAGCVRATVTWLRPRHTNRANFTLLVACYGMVVRHGVVPRWYITVVHHVACHGGTMQFSSSNRKLPDRTEQYDDAAEVVSAARQNAGRCIPQMKACARQCSLHDRWKSGYGVLG